MEWGSLDKWQGLINNDYLAEAMTMLVGENVIVTHLKLLAILR